MKRCPQCSFVYLDTDDHCDLDGTLLVHAEDSEIDSVSSQGKPAPSAQTQGRAGKALAVIAAAVLLLAVVLFLYYGANRKNQPAGQVNEHDSGQALATPSVAPQQTSTATPTPKPEASPAVDTPSAPNSSTSPSSHPRGSRESVSSNPVSTGNENAKKGPLFIRLTNGVRIEADEVWRTKDGFWYRSNGVVTLIKANQVKGLEKASPKP